MHAFLMTETHSTGGVEVRYIILKGIICALGIGNCYLYTGNLELFSVLPTQICSVRATIYHVLIRLFPFAISNFSMSINKTANKQCRNQEWISMAYQTTNTFQYPSKKLFWVRRLQKRKQALRMWMYSYMFSSYMDKCGTLLLYET